VKMLSVRVSVKTVQIRYMPSLWVHVLHTVPWYHLPAERVAWEALGAEGPQQPGERGPKRLAAVILASRDVTHALDGYPSVRNKPHRPLVGRHRK
jgi:hypothetical protein